MSSLSLCIIFPFLMAYAAASDLLTMTIPNRLNGVLVAAFVLHAVGAGLGWPELAEHVGAGALTLTVTFSLFAFGLIGGGDAKLAAATALWLGFGHLAEYLLVASLLGGLLTLVILYMRTYPLPAFTTRLPFAMNLHHAETGIPYGIALAGAALVVLPGTEAWLRLATL